MLEVVTDAVSDALIQIEPNGLQRQGICLWLKADWKGTEEQLYLIAEIADAFKVEDVPLQEIRNQQGQVLGYGMAMKDAESKKFDKTTVKIALSKEAIEFVLLSYPPVQTPAYAGREKVRLLRALRDRVPKAKEESEDTEKDAE